MTKLDELKALMAAIETQEPMAEYTVVGIKTLSALIAAVGALKATLLLFDGDHHRLGLTATKRFADQMEANRAALKPFGK